MAHGPNRRTMLAGLAGVAGVGGSAALASPAVSPSAPDSAPRAVLVYRAVALLEAGIAHGKTPLGERSRVPIIGGHFAGPDIRGRILSGGSDWQLRRADGILELLASYYMETDDGVLIQVTNRGLLNLPKPDGPALYAMSTPVFEAPMGRYGWLNQHIFTGTVAPGGADGPSVTLAIYKML